MNKFSIIYIFTLLLVVQAFAQPNSTGINNTNPSKLAALDVQNAATFSQGILIPRLPGSDTATIKATITAAEKGLMFFDITNNVYQFWNGTRWWQFGSAQASNNAWQLTGNTLTAADTGTIGFKYLGTNAAYPLILATDGKQRMRVTRTGNVLIGNTTYGGIPLQLKSNGTGTVFQIEQSGSTNPLFDFKQNPNQNARLLGYNSGGSIGFEFTADYAQPSYLLAGKFGIGTDVPSEMLHLYKGNLLMYGESFDPENPTDGSAKVIWEGSDNNRHVLLKQAGTQDLALYAYKDATTFYKHTTFTQGGLLAVGDKISKTSLYPFSVDNGGNILSIRGLSYSWPTAQGVGVLSNDGTGTLTWGAGSAGGSLWTEDASKGYMYATDATYRVGIGKAATDPRARLEVTETASGKTDFLALTGGNGSMLFSNLGSYNQIGSTSWDYSAGRDLFITASKVVGEGIFVSQDMVGIGTVTPKMTLHVASDGLGSVANMMLEGHSTSATRGPGIAVYRSKGTLAAPAAVSDGDFLGGISFSGYSGGYYLSSAIKAEVDGAVVGTSIPGALVFSTTTLGSSTYSEKMRITASGNVGIGTATPTEVLHVDGNVVIPAANDYKYASPKTRVMSVSPVAFIDIRNNVDEAYNFATNPAYIYYTVVGTTYLYAPVNIPDGTTVTKIELENFDNTVAATIEMDLMQQTSGSAVSVGALTSTDVASVKKDASAALSVLINNSTNSYYLRARISNGSGTGVRFMRAIITYTTNYAD